MSDFKIVWIKINWLRMPTIEIKTVKNYPRISRNYSKERFSFCATCAGWPHAKFLAYGNFLLGLCQKYILLMVISWRLVTHIFFLALSSTSITFFPKLPTTLSHASEVRGKSTLERKLICRNRVSNSQPPGSYLIQPLGVQFFNWVMGFPIKYIGFSARSMLRTLHVQRWCGLV